MSDTQSNLNSYKNFLLEFKIKRLKRVIQNDFPCPINKRVITTHSNIVDSPKRVLIGSKAPLTFLIKALLLLFFLLLNHLITTAVKAEFMVYCHH